MSRRKPSPFTNCETKEGFLVALQSQLASGKLTEAEFNAARLLCKLKGWDAPPSETSEASVAPEVNPPTVAPVSGGDGLWHWRQDSGAPWSRGLTTEEMVAEYNSQAIPGMKAARAEYDRAGIPSYRRGRYWAIGVLTPKGFNQNLCVELPCTVEKLDALNAEPDPRSLPHW